ncbi:lytic transglycosylase domain-containing protein [Actinoplanes sp. TFC3]|uniref:lytic transglycosylase domain-containing protein n=1 Tax=Actinoplanes sp. TFC3 TaxID=1710355 RepID=UPI00082C2A7C|nr:lytic transglycosylase domain-containing protein [Actinoplanes sp. TFC3]
MGRRLRWFIGGLIGAMMLTGCGLGGHDADPASPAIAAAPPATSEEPFTGTVEALPTLPSLPPSAPAPSRTKAKPKPKPSKTSASPAADPNNFQLPACAHREGKLVSKSKAKAALQAAAGRTYWPGSAPQLRVPNRLVLVTAWHESGWQSNIVNCDGGRGLMQVMPDTESFLNQRFEQTYDASDYRQNASLGANYIAWLTRAFGDAYFGHKYDLSPEKCRTQSSMCLLNMVIAGYNVGRGPVDEGYATKRLPNPEYVGVVRSLMSSCYCDKY